MLEILIFTTTSYHCCCLLAAASAGYSTKSPGLKVNKLRYALGDVFNYQDQTVHFIAFTFCL